MIKNYFTEEILAWFLLVQKVEFRNKYHLTSCTLLFYVDGVHGVGIYRSIAADTHIAIY